MPDGLKRYQQAQDLHFITWSCYQRKPYLSSPQAKQTVEHVLEQIRARHGARIYGYVLMPEHVHLLINERFDLPLDQFIKAVKQQTSRLLKGDRDRFWQKRYYDHNIHAEADDHFHEKLRYLHRNPVVRGLVHSPEQYPWSSFRHYSTGERGTVEIESEWLAAERRRQQSHSSQEAEAR